MKITVATLHFGEVPYFKYSEAINREYCRRHLYQFEIIGAPRQIERAPMWFKVKGVSELLRNCDYVLFTDADAYFIDLSKSIESLIAEHMGDAPMLIGTDRFNKAFAFSDSDANCGVFLVQRSEIAFSILDEWWNVPIHHDKTWLWRWPPEQGAFNYVVRPRWSAGQIRMIPYSHMNGSDGVYIRHLMGFSNYDRLKLLRDEANRMLAR
jgi:hypothetical protein